MESLKGLKVVDGCALAPAYIVHFRTPVNLSSDESPKSVEENTATFRLVRSQVLRNIEATESRLKIAGRTSDAEIFFAHSQMLQDPEWESLIFDNLKKGQNLASAIRESATFFENQFLQIKDPYFQQRAADIKDLASQLEALVLGTANTAKLKDLTEKVILVIDELTPSMAAQISIQTISGVVCEEGGLTSHAALILKNLEIPTIFGVKNISQKVSNGQNLFVDAQENSVFWNLNKNEESKALERTNLWRSEQLALNQFIKKPTQTSQGVPFELLANLGLEEDIDLAFSKGAPGVGLFRTEFLFMKNNLAPTEDEQYKVYSKVLRVFPNSKVVIRTLDVGGDKALPYIKISKEENPFLGLRGLRLCLKEKELFFTQLKALLRASAHGNLHVMFPMVTEVKEFHEAMKCVEQAKQTLEFQGVKFGQPKWGIMVEVPACALAIETFLNDIQFISLGTNDLTQYMCAVDRNNPEVKNLYNSRHPGVVALIEHVLKKAAGRNIPVSLCGEMASATETLPLLLKIGLRSLSVAPGRFLAMRRALSLVE